MRISWQDRTMPREHDSPRRVPRFHCDAPLAVGMVRELPAAAGHHAARVLRLGVGDAVRVFCGDGLEWDSLITRIERDRVSVRLTQSRQASVESPLHITLAQGLSSREKMDLTLQKATELGVARIVPVVTAKSVVKLDEERAERRIAHWHGIVAAACEQCGRNSVPEVERVQRFEQWITGLPAPGDSLRLLLSPGSERRLRDITPPPAVMLLVGPEGGLTVEERRIAERFGFSAIVLGPRVLRTETAALAAVAAMHVLWGDF